MCVSAPCLHLSLTVAHASGGTLPSMLSTSAHCLVTRSMYARVLSVSQRFHRIYLVVVHTSGGTLRRILRGSARCFGHIFPESCPNVPSRTEGDRPSKKEGHDLFKYGARSHASTEWQESQVTVQGRMKTMSHESLCLALPCFPLLFHAWPSLAFHCFTLLGLYLPSLALLSLSLRCVAVLRLDLPRVAVPCLPLPCFANLCLALPDCAGIHLYSDILISVTAGRPKTF